MRDTNNTRALLVVVKTGATEEMWRGVSSAQWEKRIKSQALDSSTDHTTEETGPDRLLPPTTVRAERGWYLSFPVQR